MADADDVRRIALALPHVLEIDSDGFDFRVVAGPDDRGKGFVWSYPESHRGRPRVIRTDVAVLFVGDEAEKQALLHSEPDLFFTHPGYDGFPLVMLRLQAVDAARLAELIRDAWHMRLPPTLAADYPASGAPTAQSEGGRLPTPSLRARAGEPQSSRARAADSPQVSS